MRRTRFIDRIPFVSARRKKLFLRWIMLHRVELIQAAVILTIAFLSVHRPF